MKHIFPALALVLCGCASAPQAQPAPPAQLSVAYPPDLIVSAGDQYLYEAERIDPRVTVLASPEPFHVQPLGNVTIIEQREGFVLVDSGGSPPAAERIAAFVRAIDPNKPVTAIILTHWHGDHVLGLRTLLAAWPQARTISTGPTRDNLLSPRTARFMPTEDAANNAALQADLAGGVAFLNGRAQEERLSAREREGYAQAGRELAQHARDHLHAARIAPAEVFTDRLLLDDADAPVEVRFLGRANTDGDAVVWLPRQRILIAGDTVVSPIPYGFGSFPGEWIGVLTAMRAMDFAVLVPGHGAPMRDRVYLDRLVALLTDVRGQVSTFAARGVPLTEAQTQVNLSAHAELFAAGDPWRRRWFTPYWAEPIIASAYREARGEPIVQGES